MTTAKVSALIAELERKKQLAETLRKEISSLEIVKTLAETMPDITPDDLAAAAEIMRGGGSPLEKTAASVPPKSLADATIEEAALAVLAEHKPPVMEFSAIAERALARGYRPRPNTPPEGILRSFRQTLDRAVAAGRLARQSAGIYMLISQEQGNGDGRVGA